MEKVCKGCGKKFTTYPSLNRQWCSKQCRFPDRNPQVSLETLLWMAGIFDGEGSVGIGRHITKTSKAPHYLLQATMTNTERQLVEPFLVFGGHVRMDKPRGIQVLPIFRWTVSANDTLHFLEQIAPHLRSYKKARCVLGIEFQQQKVDGGRVKDSYNQTQEAYWNRMRAIKREVVS